MTITIHDKKEIVAQGIHTNKNCKPVFCITTGEIFASVTDAAKANNVDISTMTGTLTGKSKTCNGKRFCLLSKCTEHIDEISETIAIRESKATKYDALIAEQERVRKIHERHEVRKAAYLKAWNALEDAKRLLEESEAEVKSLKGGNQA